MGLSSLRALLNHWTPLKGTTLKTGVMPGGEHVQGFGNGALQSNFL